MKLRSVFFACLLLTLGTMVLPNDGAISAAPRTPVSCSYQQFHFSQAILLVTTKGGQLFRSGDTTWQALPAPTGWDEMSVAADGVIYLLDSAYNIHRSIDRGATWQQSGQAPIRTGAIFNLSASPVPELIFLCACRQQDNGIDRSEDGGARWERVLGGCGGSLISFSPDFARDGLAYATTSFKIGADFWKSADWGHTWLLAWQSWATPFAFRGGVAFSPQFAEDRTAFTDAAESYAPPSLYKTTDAGATWFKVNALSVDGPPAFSPDYLHDQTFVVGQNDGLALSQDGGRTLPPIWDQANGVTVAWGVRRRDAGAAPAVRPPPLPDARRYYLPLLINNPPPLEFWLVAQEAASQNCYLYRSRDEGASWQEISVP